MTNGVVAPHEVYPPLSWVNSMSRNVNVPSRLAPARIRISVGWRVGEATNSSRRSNTSFTGRPVLRARWTAIGS